MISIEDANSTYEYSDYYKILPQIYEWAKDNARIKRKKVPEGFEYVSNNNSVWMTNFITKMDTNNKYFIENSKYDSYGKQEITESDIEEVERVLLFDFLTQE